MFPGQLRFREGDQADVPPKRYTGSTENRHAMFIVSGPLNRNGSERRLRTRPGTRRGVAVGGQRIRYRNDSSTQKVAVFDRNPTACVWVAMFILCRFNYTFSPFARSPFAVIRFNRAVNLVVSRIASSGITTILPIKESPLC